MILKTKLDVGDYMWFMLNNKVEHREITGIHVKVVTDHAANSNNTEKIRITYTPKNLNDVSETRAFNTKADLIKSL